MPKIVMPPPPGGEALVLRECRDWLANQPDITIHRNGTGQAVISAAEFVSRGMDEVSAQVAASVVRQKFRSMRFGLAVGSSDLIGTLTVAFGNLDLSVQAKALFLAIELKRPGEKPNDDQLRFLAHKRSVGAVAFWADSLDMVQDRIGRARRWEPLPSL